MKDHSALHTRFLRGSLSTQLENLASHLARIAANLNAPEQPMAVVELIDESRFLLNGLYLISP